MARPIATTAGDIFGMLVMLTEMRGCPLFPGYEQWARRALDLFLNWEDKSWDESFLAGVERFTSVLALATAVHRHNEENQGAQLTETIQADIIKLNPDDHPIFNTLSDATSALLCTVKVALYFLESDPTESSTMFQHLRAVKAAYATESKSQVPETQAASGLARQHSASALDQESVFRAGNIPNQTQPPVQVASSHYRQTRPLIRGSTKENILKPDPRAPEEPVIPCLPPNYYPGHYARLQLAFPMPYIPVPPTHTSPSKRKAEAISQGSSLDEHPLAEGQFYCEWDKCDYRLFCHELEAHLHDVHFVRYEAFLPRTLCIWGPSCGKIVKNQNLPRHICNIHLKLEGEGSSTRNSVQCPTKKARTC